MELLQFFTDVDHNKQPLLTEKYAALKELNDTVANNPGIKKWLSERPQTADWQSCRAHSHLSTRNKNRGNYWMTESMLESLKA